MNLRFGRIREKVFLKIPWVPASSTDLRWRWTNGGKDKAHILTSLTHIRRVASEIGDAGRDEGALVLNAPP